MKRNLPVRQNTIPEELQKIDSIRLTKSRKESCMKSGFLNLCSININGLGNKRTQLESYLHSKDIHICLIQETKKVTPILAGYQCVLNNERKEGGGGGICIYVKDSIEIEEAWTLENNTTQCNGFVINGMLIVNVYRPPQMNYTKYRAEDLDLWHKLKNLHYKKLLIAGDFNLRNTDVNKCTSQNGISGWTCVEFCEYKHMINLVKQATRKDGAMLDWVLTNEPNYIVNLSVDSEGMETLANDHAPILFQLLTPGMKLEETVIECRKLKNADWNKYRELISKISLSGTSDIDQKAEKLAQEILAAFDEIAPVQQINVTDRLPYDNGKSLHLLKRVRKYTRKRHLTEEEKEIKRNVQKELYTLRTNLRIRKELKLIASKNVTELARYRKQKKRLIKKIVDKNDNNTTSTTSKEIVEAFANHHEKQQRKPKTKKLNINYDETDTSLHEIRIQKKDLVRSIETLKLSGAPGPDDITTTMLQRAKADVAEKLYEISVEIMETGYYPKSWKKTNITPIYKKGVKSDMDNYRLIQCSSILGKVFENVIQKQLYEYAEINQLLPDVQHGFRRKKSVVTNLVEFYSKIELELDKGNGFDAVYIDFSKAFDLMNREILIDKLSKMGIRGKFLQLLSSYLQDRSGRFKQGLDFSKNLGQEIGSPQGGLLSPCLFILYTSDLAKKIQSDPILKNLIFSTYADDSKLGIPVNLKHTTKNEMQYALDRLSQWVKENELKINASKTKVVHFGGVLNPRYEYKIDGQKIEETYKITDLGVIVNEKLDWSDHVSNQVSRAKQKFMELRNKFFIKNSTLLSRIYKTYLEPILLYGCQLWIGSNPDMLRPLIQVQQFMFRGTKIQELEELPYDILTRGNMLTLSFMHSIIHQNAHLDTSAFYEDVRQINNRHLEPRPIEVTKKTKYQDKGFGKYARLLWKYMKVQHKRIQNKLTFKKNTEEVWTESKQNVIISRSSRHPYDKLYGVTEVLANQKEFRKRTLFARGSR